MKNINKAAIVGIVAAMAISIQGMCCVAEEGDTSNAFVPDDMMNENSISSEEFTELTGVTFKEITADEADELLLKKAEEDRIAAGEPEETVDPNFVADDMMNENSISPEEFTELTGVTFKEITADEADELRLKNAEKLLQTAATSTKESLTWGTTKPYSGDTWSWDIVYKLDNCTISSTYTSYASANTYSQEAMEISSSDTKLITITPTDSNTNQIRAYVHFVDKTTSAETTSNTIGVISSSVRYYTLSNPNSRNMYVFINFANPTSTDRQGKIVIESTP